jgi:hypothetical protein
MVFLSLHKKISRKKLKAKNFEKKCKIQKTTGLIVIVSNFYGQFFVPMCPFESY